MEDNYTYIKDDSIYTEDFEGVDYSYSEDFEGIGITDEISFEYGPEKLKLYQKISEMSPREKRIFGKLIQYRALMDVLRAVKNLKKTPAEEWKRIIEKLNTIKNIKLDTKDKVDFNKILETIIPLLGYLAGMLLALREAEKKEIESAEPDEKDNPLLNDPSLKDNNTQKSIVLTMCNENENGFSF